MPLRAHRSGGVPVRGRGRGGDRVRRPVGDVPARRRDDGRVAALARPRAPRLARWSGCAPERAHRRVAVARALGEPARRHAGTVPWGVIASTPPGSASSPTTTGCPSTGCSWGRPAGAWTGSSPRATPRVWTPSIDVDSSRLPVPAPDRRRRAPRRDARLVVDTTIVPTGRRRRSRGVRLAPVPPAPGTPRRSWTPAAPVARAPRARRARHTHRRSTRASARGGPDRLAHLRRPVHARARPPLAFEGDERPRRRAPLRHWLPHAQVWVPPGRDFAALEPMTAPTNALVPATRPWSRPATATSRASRCGSADRARTSRNSLCDDYRSAQVFAQ